MVYPVNPADPTRPYDTDPAGEGAAELRALKGYIAGLLPAPFTNANLFRKNLIINGDFSFDQRNEGVTIALNTTAKYPVDKFVASVYAGITATGQRVAGAIAPYALAINITVATNPLAASIANIRTAIEGYDVAYLKLGSAAPLPISISFLVTSPVTGPHSIALRNSANNRSYVTTFNVAVANTQQVISINNIPGDTAGTWLTNNGIGLEVVFDLGSGTNLETANASVWQAGAFTRFQISARPCAAGGLFTIENLQVEQATAASQFEQLSYVTKNLLCCRYFEKSFSAGIAPAQNISDTPGILYGVLWSAAINNGIGAAFASYAAAKRTAPTITTYNPAAADSGFRNFTNVAGSVGRIAQTSTHTLTIAATTGVGAPNAVGDSIGICWTAAADFY